MNWCSPPQRLEPGWYARKYMSTASRKICPRLRWREIRRRLIFRKVVASSLKETMWVLFIAPPPTCITFQSATNPAALGEVWDGRAGKSSGLAVIYIEANWRLRTGAQIAGCLTLPCRCISLRFMQLLGWVALRA